MTYLGWALFIEGQTDRRYLEALIPRLVQDLALRLNGPEMTVPEYPVDIFGVRARDLDKAASQIRDAAEAFQVLFVHGDTGSPSEELRLATRTCALCEKVEGNLIRERCVILTPRRETEAWCLSDKDALRSALGAGKGLDLSFVPDDPLEIERTTDPKAMIRRIQCSIESRVRRKVPPVPYANFGRMQNLVCLRRLPSFQDFENNLINALRTFGYM